MGFLAELANACKKVAVIQRHATAHESAGLAAFEFEELAAVSEVIHRLFRTSFQLLSL